MQNGIFISHFELMRVSARAQWHREEESSGFGDWVGGKEDSSQMVQALSGEELGP